MDGRALVAAASGVILLTACGGGGSAPSSAGASSASAAPVAKTIDVKVPIPANPAYVAGATSNPVPQFSLVALPDAAGAIKVTLANDGQVNPSTQVIAVVTDPAPGKAGGGQVMAIVNAWPLARPQSAAAGPRVLAFRDASTSFLDLRIETTTPATHSSYENNPALKQAGCGELEELNTKFEEKASVVNSDGFIDTLYSLRTKQEQDTDPEEILDRAIFQGWSLLNCTGSPEALDDGGS